MKPRGFFPLYFNSLSMKRQIHCGSGIGQCFVACVALTIGCPVSVRPVHSLVAGFSKNATFVSRESWNLAATHVVKMEMTVLDFS